MPRLIFAAVAVVLTAVWLLSGRGALGVPNEWMLRPNERVWPLGAWLLPLGIVVIFGGAALLSVYDRFKRAKTRREQTNSTITALVCLGLVLFLWPWALLGPGDVQRAGGRLTLEGRFNVIAALWSDVATEYFGTAYQVEDAGQFLRDYPRYQTPERRELAHVATHPPGAVLFFYAARRAVENAPPLRASLSGLATTITGQNLSELTSTANLLRATVNASVDAPEPPPLASSAIASALLSAILLGLSLVAAIPAVYGLAATGLSGDEAEKRGLLAAALWALAPTTNIFAFTLDALVAAGVVWSLFFVARGVASVQSGSKRALFWFGAGGLTLALTTFFSFGALAAGLIVLATTVFALRRGALRSLLVFGGAFGIFWLVIALVGASPFEILTRALAAHRFATLEVRSWGAWVLMNLVVFAVFAGWAFWSAWKRPSRGDLGAENARDVARFVALAAILTILCLTLGGNVRGEVERLWLFLLAPLGGALAASLPGRVAAGLVAIQTAQTLLMAATLAPLVRPF